MAIYRSWARCANMGELQKLMSSNQPGERFETFVRDFGERAFLFAYRLSGNVDEAKDLVQESFRRVVSHWSRFDQSRSLEAWYCAVLRHVFLDVRRSYDARNCVPLDAPAGEEGESVSDLMASEEESALASLERAEKGSEVRAVLMRLPYHLRAVLTLCDMQGACYEEAAEVLQIPSGTVRSRLSRARSAFRRLAARTLEVDA